MFEISSRTKQSWIEEYLEYQFLQENILKAQNFINKIQALSSCEAPWKLFWY